MLIQVNVMTLMKRRKKNGKTYYIKTNGNEDNGFQPIICGYDYVQYKEVVASLRERKVPYVTWCE